MENYILSDTFFSLNCRGKLVDLSVPKIMGILNVTPDSFSDGGKYNDLKRALQQAENMLKEGADFIDIGAQSTRPKAEYLSSDEEIRRIGNVIGEIRKEFPEALISLDTFYADVVKFGFNEGIDLINDISAGQFDDKMFETVANTGLPYILMHINSTYHMMHHNVEYEDIMVFINRFFSKKVNELRDFGIKDIILDPGFGFGKMIEDQIKMINEAEFFGFGNYPVLIGISRKSFIYKPLGKSPVEIKNETRKLHQNLLQKGVKILRVHDVKEAKNLLK